MIPQNYVKLESKDAEKMLKLMDALEDNDDVPPVSAPLALTAEELAKIM